MNKQLMQDRWSFLQSLVSEKAPVEEIAEASRAYSDTCRLYLISKN